MSCGISEGGNTVFEILAKNYHNKGFGFQKFQKDALLRFLGFKYVSSEKHYIALDRTEQYSTCTRIKTINTFAMKTYSI